MADNIKFINTNTLEEIGVKAPKFGYRLILMMALEFRESSNGKISVRDNGITNDKRILEISSDYDKTEQQTVYDFLFKNINRGENLKLNLDDLDSDNNFFPGGPDKGNQGDFLLAPLHQTWGPIKREPYNWFQPSLRFILNSFPSYSLPSRTGYSEGEFFIDSITGLREPEDFSPKEIAGKSFTLSQGNNYSIVDLGKESTTRKTTFTLICNQPNAATVLNYLQTTIRKNIFLISNVAELYPFGIGVTASANVQCKLNKPEIIVTHRDDNKYYFEFSLTQEPV